MRQALFPHVDFLIHTRKTMSHVNVCNPHVKMFTLTLTLERKQELVKKRLTDLKCHVLCQHVKTSHVKKNPVSCKWM